MVRDVMAGLTRPARSLRCLFELRPLASTEQQFLADEFGDSLDLARVRIAGGGHPFGRLGWQPGAGLIQLVDRCFENDDPAQPIREQLWPVLAHEALHVWQRVHRHHRLGVSIDGIWLGLVKGRAAYRYDASSAEPADVLRTFLAGNIEQQGQMFEDYVRSNVHQVRARDAKFAEVARYVRERRPPVLRRAADRADLPK